MIGTSVDAIDEASDRERFEAFASRIGVRMPRGEICRTPDEVRHAADAIGLPILVRPSYVLGGEGWRSSAPMPKSRPISTRHG